MWTLGIVSTLFFGYIVLKDSHLSNFVFYIKYLLLRKKIDVLGNPEVPVPKLNKIKNNKWEIIFNINNREFALPITLKRSPQSIYINNIHSGDEDVTENVMPYCNSILYFKVLPSITPLQLGYDSLSFSCADIFGKIYLKTFTKDDQINFDNE